MEPVRSAEPPIISGSATVSVVEREFGRRRGWRCLSAPRASCCFTRGDRRRELAGKLAARGGARTRRACRVERGEALFPGQRAPACRVRRRRAMRRGCPRGISNGGAVQPSFCRAGAISSAPSGEPWAFSVPPLFGAPKPIVVRQAISDGPVGFLRRFERRGDRRRIVAVDARRRPAGGFETLDLIDRVRQRGRPVDRNAVVVVEHDQLFQLQMAGERDRFLADAFHQVAVGDEHIGACDRRCRRRTAPRGGAPRSPCRRRWRAPGRAARWWFRRPAYGRVRDGRA